MQKRCLLLPLLCFLYQLPVQSSDLSGLADRFDQSAVTAWSRGNFLEARNCWFKYMEVARRDPSLRDSSRTKEIFELFARASAQLDTLSSETFSAFDEDHDHTKAKQKTVRKLKRSTTRNDSSSNRILKRAQKAERQGHLEYAHQLYSIAEKLDPDSVDAKNRKKSLQKEIE